MEAVNPYESPRIPDGADGDGPFAVEATLVEYPNVFRHDGTGMSRYEELLRERRSLREPSHFNGRYPSHRVSVTNFFLEEALRDPARGLHLFTLGDDFLLDEKGALMLERLVSVRARLRVIIATDPELSPWSLAPDAKIIDRPKEWDSAVMVAGEGAHAMVYHAHAFGESDWPRQSFSAHDRPASEILTRVHFESPDTERYRAIIEGAFA
jgi:hypothetical protein